VLDIGTGTGLLALMTAQRAAGASIDALELDSGACAQATANFAASPWASKIRILWGDVNGYALPERYDVIVCNPPFFNNSLPSSDGARTMARHTTTLSYEQLYEAIARNLSDDGIAAVLLPVAEYGLFRMVFESHGWHEQRVLQIRHTATAEPKRIVAVIGRQPVVNVVTEQLIIKDAANQYTPEFSALLAPFYLAL
jgi:tRNA1Val (adenine37-N6)-methyltransferase